MSEYIELKQGTKYATPDGDTLINTKGTADVGYLLQDHEMVIDIDCLSKEAIQDMIERFEIGTEYRLTDRGIHLYYKKPKRLVKANSICALGIGVEYKMTPSSKSVVIKRNGVERPQFNKGIREEVPAFLMPNKVYNDLTGYGEAEGRNNALFQHRVSISNVDEWRSVIAFINTHVFDEPLPQSEVETICRNMKIEAQRDGEYDVATTLMREYRMVKYQNKVYYYHNKEYLCDPNVLTRLIFEQVGNQKTRYVDEVMKQIQARTKLIDVDKEFTVKFKNGVLKDGKFIEMEYKDFTPYSIDINYYPDAEIDEDVDNYVKHLTNSEPEYQDLLFEILGHTLITNREVKRQLGRVFFFVGGGGNGKGTLLQIIKMILNTKNCTALSIKEMKDDRFLTSMKGKLANLGDDVHNSAIDDDMMKILKNISTCDYVATRELYASAESMIFTNTLIFTTNHLIKSFEKGDSWVRRAVWLPMYSVVSEKNKDARFISKQTTDHALEYWVSKMVAGYIRLCENGDFTKSNLVEAENVRYHQENNGLLLFLEDYTKDMLIGKRYMDVYRNDYVPWIEENGGTVQSQKAFKESVMAVMELDVQPRKLNGKSARVFVSADKKTMYLNKFKETKEGEA